MKIIASKPQPKFTRKPIPSIHKQPSLHSLQLSSKGSSAKKLKINNNVLNLMVFAPNQHSEVELSRLLFTNQKTTDYPSPQKYRQSIHNSTITKKIFLQYSPDSPITSPSRRTSHNDSEILIEGYSKQSEKEEASTNFATSFTFQKSQECNQLEEHPTNISPFELVDHEKKNIPASSFGLSFITSNQYIFQVTYCFQSLARITLSEQKMLFQGHSRTLINRIRHFFKKFPLSLFVFYVDVLKEYEHIQLRQFLMKSLIKYTSNEITTLQQHIDQALDMCKPQEVLQCMFMSEEQDGMIIINLTDSGIQNQITPSQNNFWKTLSPIFQNHPHAEGIVGFQFRKMEEFLFKLI